MKSVCIKTYLTLFTLLLCPKMYSMAGTAQMPSDKKVADLSVKDLQQMIKDTIQSLLAFVDPYSILQKLDEVKDAEQKLKADLEAKERQIVDIQNKIKQKEAEFQAKAPALSPDAREKYQSDIMSLRAQGQTKLEGLQAFMQQAQQELEMRFLKKIQEAAEEIANEEGIILVQGAGIVYGSKALNISDKVSARMNKKYGEEKRKSMKPVITPAAQPSSLPTAPK
ncbi:MAG TPA: OmpH family outer membrane protein [Candidatus Babeliales bacterium]|nr:OmpH family outer membrane protein [Candidatus Babeliales bacterium]